jgi:hypothetical protein
LSRSPYHRTRPLRQTSTPATRCTLYPMFIRPPCTAMGKTPRQLFPTDTPTNTLRPYDKICAHLHRLHTRIKNAADIQVR